MLNFYPVIEVSDGLRAQIGLFCKPYPRNRVNSKYNLCAVLQNHILSAYFFITIFYKYIFDKVAYSFPYLFLCCLENLFHLGLYFEIDIFEVEFFSVFAYYSQKCVLCILFINNFLYIFIDDRHKRCCDGFFGINIC